MRHWRISNHADLTGEGGRLAAGRWNRLGRRVVYLAEHPALALLETLVHLEVDPEDIPDRYRMLTVDAPDDVPVGTWRTEDLDLEWPEWRSDAEITRALAEPFFEEERHVLLRVPSVLVPEAYNALLNPAHPEAGRFSITGDVSAMLDPRLLGSR